MPFTPLDRLRRRVQVLEQFFSETNITRVEDGSIAKSLYDAIISELEASEERADELVSQSNPLTSTGPYLDGWLDFFGIEKEDATRALALASDRVVRLYVKNGTFADLNNGSPVTINSSQFIASGNTRQITDRGVEDFPVEYELPEDITLDPGDSELYIDLIATIPGDDQNIATGQLVSHNFTSYDSYPNIELLIENIAPIVNGRSEEDEDDSRYKLSRIALVKPLGLEDQLAIVANRIPGVTDVIAVTDYSGTGTIDIFIDTEAFTIPDSLVDEVEDAVNEVARTSQNVFVNKMPRVGISLETKVKFKIGTSEETKSEVLRRIEFDILSRIVETRPGESIDFQTLYEETLRTYASISSLGSNSRFFDRVVIYRNGFGDKRFGSNMDLDSTTLTLKEFERLLPEDGVIKPVLITERVNV